MKLRDVLQRVALEFPSYGWPRMTRDLKRRGWAVNHKRVYRLMRQDNLLCLRRRKFVVTTDSQHGLPVYANLARAMALSGLDQLWVADITYIRLELEFVYLAVILDAFSRRVIGWALDHRERGEGLSVERMCALGGVSRAGFYRFRPDSSRGLGSVGRQRSSSGRLQFPLLVDALQAPFRKTDLQRLLADLTLQLRDPALLPARFPGPGNALPGP